MWFATRVSSWMYPAMDDRREVWHLQVWQGDAEGLCPGGVACYREEHGELERSDRRRTRLEEHQGVRCSQHLGTRRRALQDGWETAGSAQNALPHSNSTRKVDEQDSKVASKRLGPV